MEVKSKIFLTILDNYKKAGPNLSLSDPSNLVTQPLSLAPVPSLRLRDGKENRTRRSVYIP